MGRCAGVCRLSIPFTEPEIHGVKTYSSLWQLPYFRLPGFSEIKKGDIVVFNKSSEVDQNIPVDQRTTLIKRCQATPGDVLTIVNGQVYINGKANPDAQKQQTSYTVVTDGTGLNPQVFDELHMEVINHPAVNTYEVIIPPDNVATLKSDSNIKSVTPYVAPAGQYAADVFPFNEKFKWNQDNFGPLLIPKRG